MAIRVVDFNDGFTSVTEPSSTLEATWEVVALQSIVSGGEVAMGLKDNQLLIVEGDSGPQVASTTPLGTVAVADGTVVRFRGDSDTNTIGFVYSDIDYGLLLNGNITLEANEHITVQFNLTALRWYEIARND